jgi:hypothetical protein
MLEMTPPSAVSGEHARAAARMRAQADWVLVRVVVYTVFRFGMVQRVQCVKDERAGFPGGLQRSGLQQRHQLNHRLSVFVHTNVKAI